MPIGIERQRKYNKLTQIVNRQDEVEQREDWENARQQDLDSEG